VVLFLQMLDWKCLLPRTVDNTRKEEALRSIITNLQLWVEKFNAMVRPLGLGDGDRLWKGL
jgi:hypothetical protein